MQAKILLFEHPNFQGRCLEITKPTPHLSKYCFNNEVSSVKVICGDWKLFEHPDFEGEKYKVCQRGGPCCNGEYPFPMAWCGENNEISSLYPIC
jgi:Beta/Gamma crystallin.